MYHEQRGRWRLSVVTVSQIVEAGQEDAHGAQRVVLMVLHDGCYIEGQLGVDGIRALDIGVCIGAVGSADEVIDAAVGDGGVLYALLGTREQCLHIVYGGRVL